ncbi:hypothetical protein BZG02_15305 [Labilibaculum filiforme]|uniref:Uncharacterized protein n=1 Tax=Labilibaculum filiforme TaxID=1940526 RepID=A0A2N3HU13_9BACT|nr:hypothetical protein [Labilibaculum filiforme]PKQ61555.1 hypothetical protein BZG02_15305 [Labilibaculum filiforme]
MTFIRSESKFLERTRIALSNAESHPDIKAALLAFGIDDAKFAEGWAVYNKAKSIWELNAKEGAETSLASNTYSRKYNEVTAKFKRHRDLTRILCTKDPDVLIELGIKGHLPGQYNEYFDLMKLFYTTIAGNAVIQAKLAVIKLTPELAADCLAALDTLLVLRSNFDKEMGESQATTELKNAALNELSDWMDDFDILAKLAFYDTPQRLEVLGVLVKS